MAESENDDTIAFLAKLVSKDWGLYMAESLYQDVRRRGEREAFRAHYSRVKSLMEGMDRYFSTAGDIPQARNYSAAIGQSLKHLSRLEEISAVVKMGRPDVPEMCGQLAAAYMMIRGLQILKQQAESRRAS